MHRTNILFMLTAYSIAYAGDIIENSFYGELNVHLGVKNPELSRAFRKQGLFFHPDKNKDPDAIEQFQNLNHIYQTLKDSEKRKKYDAELATDLLKSDNEFAHVIGYQMQEEDITESFDTEFYLPHILMLLVLQKRQRVFR